MAQTWPVVYAGSTFLILFISTAPSRINAWLRRDGGGADWYERARPDLAPPGSVIGTVWALLYPTLAIALAETLRLERSARRDEALGFLGFNLVCNFLWTIFYFGLHNPILSLVDILLMDLSQLAFCIHIWGVRPWISVLLWPYLLWICFATVLNIGTVEKLSASRGGA